MPEIVLRTDAKKKKKKKKTQALASISSWSSKVDAYFIK